MRPFFGLVTALSNYFITLRFISVMCVAFC